MWIGALTDAAKIASTFRAPPRVPQAHSSETDASGPNPIGSAGLGWPIQHALGPAQPVRSSARAPVISLSPIITSPHSSPPPGLGSAQGFSLSPDLSTVMLHLLGQAQPCQAQTYTGVPRSGFTHHIMGWAADTEKITHTHLTPLRRGGCRVIYPHDHLQQRRTVAGLPTAHDLLHSSPSAPSLPAGRA